MPNHKSAMKRARQNETRRLRNRKVKSNMRSAIKRLRASIAEGNAQEAAQNLPAAVRLVQRAASKGVIHANTAQRTVSRLVRAVNGMGGDAKASAAS